MSQVEKSGIYRKKLPEIRGVTGPDTAQLPPPQVVVPVSPKKISVAPERPTIPSPAKKPKPIKDRMGGY